MKLVVGHFGDIHLDESNRFDDGVAALRFIAEEGKRRGVNLWLDGGDTTGTDSPHVMSIRERNVLTPFYQALASQGPVVKIRGNHDSSGDHDITAELRGHITAELRGPHEIYYRESPDIIRINFSGPKRVGPAVAIYTLPYPSKIWLAARGDLPSDLVGQKQAMEAGLRSLLEAWRQDAITAREHDYMTLGLFHLNIGGSRLAGSEILIGQEVELAPHDLDELGFDAGFLSHIHRAQEITRNWRYAGAPYRQNYGEESYEPSFTICTLEPGKAPVWDLVRTPTAKLVTIRKGSAGKREDIVGADVRYQMDVTEEELVKIDKARLEKEMLEQGARSVVFDIHAIPKQRVRSDAIVMAKTDAERLDAYFQSEGRSAPSKTQQERCHAKLHQLEDEPIG